MDVIQFALLGIGAGAAYSLSALGLVVIFRGSGVLNFSQGVLGFWAANLFVLLRDDLAWPAVAAVPAAIAAAGTAAGAFQHLVLRHLKGGVVTHVVATIALLAFLQSLGAVVVGDAQRLVPPLLNTTPLDLGGVVLGQDRLELAGIAVALTAALHVVSARTRFGHATQAVAQGGKAAAAIGIPVDLVAASTWALGGCLSATAAILIVNITGLSLLGLSMLLFPALAAALLGGMKSYWVVLAAGLMLGVAEAEVTRFVTVPGAATAVPFIVIIVALTIRGTTLPGRGYTAATLGRVLPAGTLVNQRTVPFAVAVAAVVLFAPVGWVDAVTTSALAAFVLLSLVVVAGLAGQISLAQFSMAGIGAFVAAHAADAFGAPFPIALLAAVLGTVPVALLVALPALRARGPALAIATLGVTVAVTALVFNNRSLTGDLHGLRVEPPAIGSLRFDSATSPRLYASMVLVFLLLAGVAVWNLRSSAAGRRMLAIRSNERAAAAAGINVVATKLYAFAVAAAIAALGGALMAYRDTVVPFTGYTAEASINSLVLAVVGGLVTPLGALLGGAMAPGGPVSLLITTVMGSAEEYFAVASCLLLLIVLVRDPDGIAPRLRRRGTTTSPPTPAVNAEADRPRRHTSPQALNVTDVTVRYGGVLAVDGVSLSVEPGTIHGLIGPNGAGKTTLLDVISGFQAPERGAVQIGSTDVTTLPPHRRLAAGVGRTFQAAELFDGLSLIENATIATRPWRRADYVLGLLRRTPAAIDASTWEMLTAMGMGDRMGDEASSAPAGVQRVVGIARAIAAGAQVLLLDEPAAGLGADETARLGQFLRRLAVERHVAVLLVEHDLDLIQTACDKVTVMANGAVLAAGPPAAVLARRDVAVAYLGAVES